MNSDILFSLHGHGRSMGRARELRSYRSWRCTTTRAVDPAEPGPRTGDPDQIRIREAPCDYSGGIFSLELEGGKSSAFEFLRRLRITKNAVSLGAMESLACHPATTTHSEMSAEQLERAGVTEGLVRVSVGIEDWRDLLAEYQRALDAL